MPSNNNALTVSSTAATPLIRNSAAGSRTTNTTTDASNTGLLQATILSTYDLELNEPPSYVELSIDDDSGSNNNKVARTGPPSQRHKDRNSFKFSANNNKLQIAAPLPELYASTATVRVVYKSKPSQNNLTASYPLHQLHIHETTWLILQLENSSTIEEENEDVPPTLRLQLTLSGPYRPEIGILVHTFEGWFRVVDACERYIQDNILSKLPAVDPKYFLIPAAPLAAILVVSAPVWIGVLTVTLPVALPILVVVGVVLAILAVTTGCVYASTATGRSHVGGTVLAPFSHTLLSTAAGQTLVYDTGPRPTPVKVARHILPTTLWGRLVVSLLIDLLGSASYLIPAAGELADVAWAPIQTVLIMAMYDATSPNLKYVSFMEEILPFTDIVPSATIGWMAEFGVPLILGNKNKEEQSATTTTRSMVSAAPKKQASGNDLHKNLILPSSGASTPVAQNT